MISALPRAAGAYPVSPCPCPSLGQHLQLLPGHAWGVREEKLGSQGCRRGFPAPGTEQGNVKGFPLLHIWVEFRGWSLPAHHGGRGCRSPRGSESSAGAPSAGPGRERHLGVSSSLARGAQPGTEPSSAPSSKPILRSQASAAQPCRPRRRSGIAAAPPGTLLLLLVVPPVTSTQPPSPAFARVLSPRIPSLQDIPSTLPCPCPAGLGWLGLRWEGLRSRTPSPGCHQGPFSGPHTSIGYFYRMGASVQPCTAPHAHPPKPCGPNTNQKPWKEPE